MDGVVQCERVPTVRLAHVTDVERIGFPDPTEDYHEASRSYPGVVDPLVGGAARLEQSIEMRVSTTRAVKRYPGRPRVPLPPSDLGWATLAAAVAGRRSSRGDGGRPLRLGELSALLHTAYGVTGDLGDPAQAARAAPSGGALYPLELYVVALELDGVEPSLHHYDPSRHALERLRLLDESEDVGQLTPYDELLRGCSALVIVSAMFWRSRFKYGARAYRFTLMEAGHVAQGLLLAAAAIGLAAVPVGGFYDRRVDAFLGIDGLYEASLYLLPVGTRLDRP
ncbi:MAG TPA: SagB family peptide dehydrogenase [Gaiella sp.]|nr:SagB family peptide dehydrogenase [Gaiella sp.]